VSDRQPPDRRLGRSADADPTFDERLAVPWWWWPLGFGVATLLAAEVHMGYPGIRAWLPYVLMVPLVGLMLAVMGRHRVALRSGELRVGPAHIAVHYLGQPEVIYPNAKRRALGPDLDPAAFVLHAGWVGPVVRIAITDPADPTPYWIFSVRRADELAALLRGGTGEVPRGNSEPRCTGR
jgi:Protein of unknown function (DUF3093)